MHSLTFDLHENHPHVLKVNGEVDLATKESLLRRIVTVPPGDLVVDCEGIEFIDAAGLGAIIASRERAEARGAAMWLSAVPQQMRRLLQTCGLEGLLSPQP